jgi:hypothetical protein
VGIADPVKPEHKRSITDMAPFLDPAFPELLELIELFMFFVASFMMASKNALASLGLTAEKAIDRTHKFLISL